MQINKKTHKQQNKTIVLSASDHDVVCPWDKIQISIREKVNSARKWNKLPHCRSVVLIKINFDWNNLFRTQMNKLTISKIFSFKFMEKANTFESCSWYTWPVHLLVFLQFINLQIKYKINSVISESNFLRLRNSWTFSFVKC